MATMEAKVLDLGYAVAGTSNNSEQALQQLGSAAADVVLMDINLDWDEEGISLARKVQGKYNIPIIFVTSMATDAVIKNAVETAPAGYLLKPVDPIELKANIALAVQKKTHPTTATNERPEYLTVRLGRTLQKTYFKDISHLTVESKNYVTLVDNQQKKFVVRGSLVKLMEAVLPNNFLRTHHSYGINLAYVASIDEPTQSIQLSTGESIPIGKVFKKEVYKRMNIA